MVTETVTKTQTCKCGTVFESREVTLRGKLIAIQAYCEKCTDRAATIAGYRKDGEKGETPEDRWLRTCPPLYLDSDPGKLGIQPETIDRVLEWEINPKGIALSGPSGAGKTRLMFMLVRKLIMDGKFVTAMSAKKFERFCHQQFVEKDDSARKSIARCRSTAVLFLDDIGKERYTPRVESEFYDLVEHRTSHKLPILWTTNADGKRLEQMMGEDRGEPIIRRLREFTEIISV